LSTPYVFWQLQPSPFFFTSNLAKPFKKQIIPGTMADITNLDKDTFQTAISEPDKTVVIDFWAPWCGPCRALTPTLEEIADELADEVSIHKVNVDENAALAAEYGVRSIPTLLVFRNGELAEQVVGNKDKAELTASFRG
jgi:thioredoxin 1